MKNELINLYTEIHNCHICPKMDNFKMQRKIESVDEYSRVFILSQGLAKLSMPLCLGPALGAPKAF